MNIYELTDAYQQVIALMEEEGGADLVDTLESIDEAVELKAENTAKVMRTIQAQATALKTEEDRMKKKRRTYENNVERLRRYIFDAMQKTGKHKIDGVHLGLRLQNNPPSLNILNDKAIPAHYLVEQPSTIDNEALKTDLKNGIAVEGAELKQDKSLRIV